MIDSFRGKYAFLSNFYPSPVELDGYVYPTVEHAYQAAKTEDVDARMSILTADKPATAKALGRGVPLREGWDDFRRNHDT